MHKTLLIAHGKPDTREKIRTAAHQAEIFDDAIAEADSPDGVEQALEEHHKFSLAVVHLRLAKDGVSIRSGLEVIRRIREALPQCVVIALTGEHHAVGREAIWAGATDFVSLRQFDGLKACPGEPEVWVKHLRQRLELWRDVNAPFMAGQS